MDAALDLKLANDAVPTSLSHSFIVLKEMAGFLDAGLAAMHALDRLVERAEQLGGLEDGDEKLRAARAEIERDYHQVRERAIEVLTEAQQLPRARPMRR
jgi:hypothetical protein